MQTPVKYSILIAESTRSLVHLVNQEMAKGWVPQGSAYLNENGHPCQPVVMY